MTMLLSLALRLLRDRRGNFAMMTAVLAVPVLFSVAAAIDMTRLMSVKETVRHAADAAALAAASSNLTTETERQQLADKIFHANIDLQKVGPLIKANNLEETGGGGIPRQYVYTVDLSLSDSATLIPIDNFWNANIEAVVQAADEQLDIALVLDNSGSMREYDARTTTRMSELITAAQSFIDVFASDGSTQIAVIPFDSQVKVDLPAISAFAGVQQNPYAEVDCSDPDIAPADVELCTANQTTTTDTTTVVTDAKPFSMNCGLLVGATDLEQSWCEMGRPGFNLPASSTGAYVTGVKRGRFCFIFCIVGYGVEASQYTATVVDGRYKIARRSEECATYFRYEVGDASPCALHDDTFGIIFNQPAPEPTTETITNTTTAYSITPGTAKAEGEIAPNASLLSQDMDAYEGCVIDRRTDYDVTGFVVPQPDSESEYPKANCATNTLATVTGLGTDFASLKNAVGAMQPSHNTNITIGVAWGMEALSAAPPLTGVRPNSRKVMVIMTDGENTQNRWIDARYVSNGRTLIDQSKSAEIDEKTLAACAIAKGQGIEIYTLNLLDADSAMLASCSNGEDYSYTADRGELIKTFEAIGRKIKRIHLTG
ncbi:VWA domain-containing protein [Notoacmeibacter ruber]|nr:VWA domain-containing protein [Notoacmeibacter ruber]